MVGVEQVVDRLIMEGIADYADHHRRWQVVLELTSSAEPILQGGVDGMIVAESYHTTREPLRQTTIPAVRVTGVPSDDGPPWVIVDNREVGRMGARYLADLGLKHLMYVPEHDAPISQHRREGFLEVCRERGIVGGVIEPAVSNNPARLQKCIAAFDQPVGLMAMNDHKALEISRACRAAGKRIPEQVAVMGVGNESETCRLVDPPLTSIDHGVRRVGYEAARLLDEWLTTGRRPQQSVTIQPIGVVPRHSTDLLAIDDPDVVAALRFIRSHTDQAIKVKDVLQHVAMSRRTLEMHFRAAVGRSIHDEIMRVRIEQAKNLLATSDWTMPHVADLCGFALASQFSFVFRRETGETPQQYRSKYRYKKH